MQVVRFTHGGERLAFPVQSVREVVPVAALSRVFRSPHFVSGVTNVRGEAIPVFDLACLFGLDAQEEQCGCAVVVESGRFRAAILASQPVDILDVPEGAGGMAPDATSAMAAVSRVLEQEGKPLLLVDVGKLFDLPAFRRLREDAEPLLPT
jgi:purine-binding chemotaxis protein CheW